MPFNAGTNRKAKDFSLYIIQRFKETIANVNATLFDNTITTGTNVVNTCAVASKNTLITGYETDFPAAISAWGFTKHASNPLIGVEYAAGIYEFYPPKIYKEDGVNWKVLAKVNNETWGSTSADGITWTAPEIFITKGTAGQWDDILCTPAFLTKEDGVYKCLITGYGDDPEYDYKIGYAYKADFTATGWTKAPSFVYDTTDYNTANGTTWDSIQLWDVVKVGTVYYYFGIVCNNTFNNGAFCYGVGQSGATIENIKLDTKIANFTELSQYYTWMQSPSVFKHPTTGIWYMTVMMGNLVQGVSTNNEAIYHFNSGRTDLPIFTVNHFKSYEIMAPDITKDYENNYNYCPIWIKNINGELTSIGGSYYMYYAGHENTATPNYTGVTCLATIATIP